MFQLGMLLLQKNEIKSSKSNFYFERRNASAIFTKDEFEME